VEPHSDGRRVRSDNVLRWWNSLEGGPHRPGHAARSLPLALLLAAAAVIASMPLAWHHVVAPAHIYYGPPTVEVVNGLSAASWLLVVAAAAVLLAVRTLIARPGLAAAWWVTVVAAALVNGMFFDYFDWNTRGVSTDVHPYYGPGFFVCLAAAASAVAAAVFAWREREAP
jgi:hypothetical protein